MVIIVNSMVIIVNLMVIIVNLMVIIVNSMVIIVNSMVIKSMVVRINDHMFYCKCQVCTWANGQ